MKSVDWEEIQRRYEKNKEVLEYMKNHPLTWEEAKEQADRLRNAANKE